LNLVFESNQKCETVAPYCPLAAPLSADPGRAMRKSTTGLG